MRKGRNCGITVGWCYFLFKKTVKRSVQCHGFAQSPPGRHLNDNIQAKVHTGPELSKNSSM